MYLFAFFYIVSSYAHIARAIFELTEEILMELGRKRKDRVSSKDAAMCRVRAKILQSLPRGSLGQSPRTKNRMQRQRRPLYAKSRGSRLVGKGTESVSWTEL